ncbi:hypothetical protein C0992_007793 [Termitomyces sp. T32_za158]|nr:hypothetical protein C0992_007793 [Termitomyces sp. T32_za158]
MSIFARPPSPPPRQPSPELGYTPLPSPHVRARHRTLSSQTSLAPSIPPGLFVQKPRKSILTVRSCNDLPSSSRSQGFPRPSTPATPRSLPSPSRSAFGEITHRRTLSNAIPYRSPPPSPTLPSPPPPVPPIPSFALSPPTPMKHCPRPAAITPIHLPDLDNVPPLTEATNPPRSRKQPSRARTPEKVAMTCLRFFSLRNSKRRTPVPQSVA